MNGRVPTSWRALTHGPLCHQKRCCAQQRRERLAAIRRERREKPVIYIGAGTCGLAAGAREIHEGHQNISRGQNIRRGHCRGGCIGLCASEPMIDIQMPGKQRVSFGPVTDPRRRIFVEKVFRRELSHRGHGHRPDTQSQRTPRGTMSPTLTSIRSSRRRPAGCWPNAD